MSGHLEAILGGSEPLDTFDRVQLKDWLTALQGDVDTFGAAPDDVRRMNAIRKRLNEPAQKPDSGPHLPQ